MDVQNINAVGTEYGVMLSRQSPVTRKQSGCSYQVSQTSSITRRSERSNSHEES
jgi:hypothetical protein